MSDTASLQVLHTQIDLDSWHAGEPGTVAFVPTMGALHAGHLALARRARDLADRVIVSIFVNPLQFGAGEDFDSYPRTLDADAAALRDVADAVFAPAVADVYPDGDPRGVPRYAAGPVGETFEGASRPGHFDGMLTVVARLLDMVKPDVAVFGQKDAQQVFLVRRLIAEHFATVSLEVVPTVREADGLAMSSRNRYLSAEERSHALVLSRALALASADPTTALAQMRALIEAEPDVNISYVDAVDASTFRSVAPFAPEAPVAPDARGVDRVAPGTTLTYIVAALVGSTRLLDTVDVTT
jgi:pantoate--beta-alanine ligase